MQKVLLMGNNTDDTLGDDVVIEDLQESDSAAIGRRTKELYELIEFDPRNKQTYQNEITEINIKLVSHMLRKFNPYTEDDFQHGCLGLIVATRSYDPARGVPFSSYACFCIQRELHKAHHSEKTKIEYILGYDLGSLDEQVTNKDGEATSPYEYVADVKADQEFIRIFSENGILTIYENVVIPVIEETTYRKTEDDLALWKKAEIALIMALSQEDKGKMNISQMSKYLGISVPNLHRRHMHVMARLKQRCEELGYYVGM